MIAIPIETLDANPMSTKLFGNAKYFALYDTRTGRNTFIPNDGCGNGTQTAAFLLNEGATSALYGFLGEGPFHAMIRGGMEVFWLGEETMNLKEAIRCALEQRLVRVTPENAELYLNPGEGISRCGCGCTHE